MRLGLIKSYFSYIYLFIDDILGFFWFCNFFAKFLKGVPHVWPDSGCPRSVPEVFQDVSGCSWPVPSFTDTQVRLLN